MKGKNEATTFLPLKLSSAGPVQYVKDRESKCLTSDEARYIYKKVENNDLVNVEINKQEIEEDRLDNGNEPEEENLYQDMIINNFEKNDVNGSISQMEQWSILSNVFNYVQYERNPRDYFKLDIKILEEKNHRKLYDRLKEEDRQVTEVDLVILQIS